MRGAHCLNMFQMECQNRYVLETIRSMDTFMTQTTNTFHLSAHRILFAAVLFFQVALSEEPWKKGELLHEEAFDHGTLENWVCEVEKPDLSVVEVRENKLMVDVGGGATIWFKHQLEGNLLIEYDVTVLQKGGSNDRVSDLNQFWMATDPDRLDLFTRSGKFSEYHPLRLYYVGMGGNNNSTTRFRRYPGGGERPLLEEHTDHPYLLKANATYHIEIVCFDGLTLFKVNGKVYHRFQDPQPLTKGYFGFRTVRNHEAIDHFKVYRLVGIDP